MTLTFGIATGGRPGWGHGQRRTSTGRYGPGSRMPTAECSAARSTTTWAMTPTAGTRRVSAAREAGYSDPQGHRVGARPASHGTERSGARASAAATAAAARHRSGSHARATGAAAAEPPPWPRPPPRAGRPRGPSGPGGPGGPGGRRRRAGVKVKGSWWRHWTMRKAIGVLLPSIIGAFIVLGAIVIAVAYEQTPVPTEAMAATSYIAVGGLLLRRHPDRPVRHHQPADARLQPDPAELIDAVLAAEDRNFCNEGGISPTGIMRAAYEDLRGGDGSLQGGSTITQEFVRNYYGGHRHPADAQPQDQGDLRGDEGRQGEVQAVDPDQLPEHHLPR